MRATLEQAIAGTQLKELIKQLGPVGLSNFLRESCGFSLRIDGTDVEGSPVVGQPGSYRFGETAIEADVGLSYAPKLQSIVQTITLRNNSSETSPVIERIDAVRIPLEVRVRDGIRALSIGGGTTEGYYPPASYREEQVSFGKNLEWEDPNPSFTRWWVAQRFFRVATDETGLSSKKQWPVMVIGWNGPTGLVGMWVSMVWSGKYQFELGCDDDWRFYLRGGPTVRKMVLEPGESVLLPAVHLGLFGGEGATMEDGANRVRRHVAQIVSPDVQGGRPWPYVAYHHWFGIEARINEKIAMEQIDTAAELGLEFVEIDAAWFSAAKGKFSEGVGNWERVDKEKFPNGLEPVAEYAKSRGIGFGLWFEPEQGRSTSDWVKQYPDFYWPAENGISNHLNLTRTDVQDTLIAMLSRWVEKLDIRWMRWDYNHGGGPAPFFDRIDPTGKIQFAYFAGLYRVWDILLERHPNLMIDNCAGGGRRSDFGTLTRAGTMVISDHAEDPHICRIMQTGAARFLPGNYTNSSIYCGEHDPDAYVDHLALTSRMAGAISLSGYISHWSETQKKFVKRYLDGFKTYRHLLMEEFYRLTSYPRTPDDWDVVEFSNAATTETVILAYRVEGPADSMTIRPVRLNAAAKYRLVDPFTGDERGHATGAELAESGIKIDLEPHDSAVYHLIVDS